MSKLIKKSAPAVVTTRAKTLTAVDRRAMRAAQQAAEAAAKIAAEAERVAERRAYQRQRYAAKRVAKLAAVAPKAQPAPVVAAPVKAQPVAQQPAQKAAPQSPAQQSLDLGVTLTQAQGALAVQLAAARKRAQDEAADPRAAGIAEGLRIAARILDLVR
jgi:hypothetical protein